MIARGLSEEFAEQVFRQIRGFGEYGFPESHATSFALLVYVSAWLKRHHPAAFTAALLNSQPMGFYAPAQLVRDAREHGVEVCAADVLRSAWDCTLEERDAGACGGTDDARAGVHARLRPANDNRTPVMITVPEIRRRSDMASPSMTTAATAVNTGVSSCTSAARQVVRWGMTEYHSA